MMGQLNPFPFLRPLALSIHGTKIPFSKKSVTFWIVVVYMLIVYSMYEVDTQYAEYSGIIRYTTP